MTIRHSAQWLRGNSRLGIWLTHSLVFALAGTFAYLLRFDFQLPDWALHQMRIAVPVWVLGKLAVFYFLGLDRGWWRYFSVPDLVRIGIGNLIGSGAAAILLVVVDHGIPRSVLLLEFVIACQGTATSRLLVRLLRDSITRPRSEGTRTLIYGAGDAGVMLLREIRSNPKLKMQVVGFIDDDPDKRGMFVHRLSILGGGSDLVDLASTHKVDEVLVAIPSADGPQMATILQHCHAAHTRCRTIPGLGEVIEGNGLSSQIRDVAVDDLLGRKPVRLEQHQIRESIEGQVVMVTGAAGSIGSELCRQIARFNPAGIVGFEIAESPLFEIDREMRLAFPRVQFHPEIGSIQNRTRIDEVLQKYRPSIIYHAAAYKHVPLMEAHVFEAIENNVFGTYNLAEAAADNGVADFVMISSDKAVRPTNVMGATKRIAELLLLALQNGRTKYVAVRFGNVLGSNGSVIPIFKKQIAAGGPVTVTHPDMRRYFMTIPEACQLVLQAAVIGEGGQICVLDMGEPVKIVDLAKNLILLSGLRPNQDINIQFSGTRPGEKLYEELNNADEDTVPTTHEKIRIFIGNGMPEDDMLTWLDRLRDICETRDTGRLVLALKEIVVDYSPSANLLKRVIPIGDDDSFSAAVATQTALANLSLALDDQVPAKVVRPATAHR